MEGEVYADFVLLWLLCHESRVEAERPEDCWLEQWAQVAREQQGTRVLDELRERRAAGDRGAGPRLFWPTPPTPRSRALAHGHAGRPGVLSPAAAAGLSPALPLRRRGPRPAARSAVRPGGAASATRATTRHAGCDSWPGASAAAGTATSTRRCGWCCARWAMIRAARAWPCPRSAASSSQLAQASATPALDACTLANRRPAGGRPRAGLSW